MKDETLIMTYGKLEEREELTIRGFIYAPKMTNIGCPQINHIVINRFTEDLVVEFSASSFHIDWSINIWKCPT